MTYLLDANVFIQAKNTYYAFSIVPAFWTWLESAHNVGTIFTVEKVAQEIAKGGDDLSAWMAGLPPLFAIAASPADQASLGALSAWANQGHFRQAAVATFLASADYYLVAQAATLGHTVVTHEKSDPRSKARVKIPDACLALGVPCVDVFALMRAEAVKF